MWNAWRAARRIAVSWSSTVIGTGGSQRFLIAASVAVISGHDMRSFVRATDTSSFITWTLMTPPAASSASAAGVLSSSWATAYTSTLVSKNTLPFMRRFAVEREPGWQRTSQLPQPLERPVAGAIATHLELARPGDPDLDLIALLQVERFDDGGRQPHG